MDIFLIRKHAEDMKKGLLAHATGLRYKIEPWETADWLEKGSPTQWMIVISAPIHGSHMRAHSEPRTDVIVLFVIVRRSSKNDNGKVWGLRDDRDCRR